jgi:hypothetical protein
MSPFEYVIVLISIILGLGITTILTGVAELIKHTRPTSLYAPYIIWIAIVFVLHLQDWWLSYQYKSKEVWELHMFLLIILYPINLYILAHLLFPSQQSDDFRTKDFYLDHYPRFFIAAILLGLLSTVQNIMMGFSFTSQAPKLIVFAVLAGVVMSGSRNNALHIVLSILLLLAVVIGLVADQESLVIR